MTVHKMADGCCSAVTPCSWQRTNPSTICDTCRSASPSVAAWLAKQREDCVDGLKSAAKSHELLAYLRGQRDAYGSAHAYAVARPGRAAHPKPFGGAARLPMVPDIADADLAYLAGLAISSKDATLARIAAALLLAR